MDRIYIVLDLTSKIVLTWAFISILRASADELEKPFDDKVSFEDKDPKSNMLNYWAWVRWGLLIGAAVVWLIMWGCDGPVHPRNKEARVAANSDEQTTLLVGDGDNDDGNASDEEEVTSYMPRVGRRRRVGLNF